VHAFAEVSHPSIVAVPARAGTGGVAELLTDVEASAVSVLGDSAGGGLAFGLARTLGEAALPQPARLVLIAPWLDLTMSNPGIPVVEARDICLPDVLLLQERGAAEGAQLHVTICDGAVHVCPLVPAPEGRAAARAIVRSVADDVGAGPTVPRPAAGEPTTGAGPAR
jgi:monoterpene epsilon-lactone hydrolase